MFTKDRSREEDERVRGEIVRVKPDYRAGLTEEQVKEFCRKKGLL